MNVAGLDISTRNLDFVILDTDNPSDCEHRRLTLAKRDGEWWETARRMRDVLPFYADDPDASGQFWGDFRLLGIERPYGPSRGSIASLHTILGAVLATIPAHITVLEVRPAEMRKALGLPGNCSKERMHNEITRLLVRTPKHSLASLATWTPDQKDAWAVAWAAFKMCEDAVGRAA